MPRRSNVLRSWRGGRNEPSFRFSAALPIICAALGVVRTLCELPAMGRSRKALLLPWPDALKHTRSQILVYACISRQSADTCVGNYFAARTSSAFGSAYFFSAIKLKNLKRPWNQMAIAKIPSTLAATQGSAMSGSLLDECRKSIVKIAETQPPAGKRAILMMAEMFRSNSGRASADGRPSLSQDFHTPAQQPVRPHRLRSRRASR